VAAISHVLADLRQPGQAGSSDEADGRQASLLGHLPAFLKNRTSTHPSAGKNPNAGERRGLGRGE